MNIKDLSKSNAEEICSETQSIRKINDQFDYKDEIPNGEGDSALVACGQDESYNELLHIYNSKLKGHVTSGKITKQEALDALCLARHELENPRKREDFYQHLTKSLNVNIS